jgi:hypothetical protein
VSVTPSIAEVERALERIYIAADGATLRKEDRKKAVELSAILRELSRLGRARHLVDAAAGKAYVGLLASELLGFERVTIIEREPARIASCREALKHLQTKAKIELREADVADASAFAGAELVVALHACGPASDLVLDNAIAAKARWLLLVPCCYANAVAFSAKATENADAMGLPRQAEVRRRFVTSLIDAERTLRLEAAGYETTVVPFVAPTVTPHNLAWRARFVGEEKRMREAEESLVRLRG